MEPSWDIPADSYNGNLEDTMMEEPCEPNMDWEDPQNWSTQEGNWDDDEQWDDEPTLDNWIDEPETMGSVEPQNLIAVQKLAYETLGPEQITGRLEEAIVEFGEMLGVQPPYDEAKLLLQYYEWNKDRATNEYFMGDQQEVRINAGIDPPEEDQVMAEAEVECPICLDDLPRSEMAALTCGHIICKDCWGDYLRESSKSRSCFKLKCPMDGCSVAATTTRLRQIDIPEEHITFLEERQNMFRLKNYVESCKDLQACLGPCEYVQKIFTERANLSDITCKCGFVYCIRCLQAGHRPCPCDVAEAWVQKATSEAENMQWILAKTKKCPKCRVPIEKNQGCNHMTCRNCRHEFCWLCKGDWKDHGSATGGFYKCNIYEKNRKGGNVSNEERAQQDAKSELERYSFYFTRYDNHIRAISQMKKTLESAEARMGSLMSQYKWKPNEASFIKDASNTIMDCRRLLAWTYPIGYYMEEDFPQRDLFHQYQKDLEIYTEHLHELAEQKLEVFRENEKRAEVINYQRVIQKYRDHLIQGIESEINPNCSFSR